MIRKKKFARTYFMLFSKFCLLLGQGRELAKGVLLIDTR